MRLPTSAAVDDVALAISSRQPLPRTPRRVMMAAGALLALVGAFGIASTIEALPGYYQSWPDWIQPIEAAAFTSADLGLAVMLALGSIRVVRWAAGWAIGCAAIAAQAVYLPGAYVPLLGGNAPAFLPSFLVSSLAPTFGVSVDDWLHGVAPERGLWFVPAALAYLLAALLLVYAWLRLRGTGWAERGACREHGLAGWGGLILEAIGVVNVYSALYLISEFRFGDLEILNWPPSIAGALGLPVAVVMVLAGHRIRHGAANRLAVGAMAAGTSFVVLLGLITGPGLPINEWVAFALRGLPYVPAPGIVLMRWTGDVQAGWIPGAGTIVIAASLFAVSAGLILGSIPWRPPTEA
jgi:hypothetical protein